MIEIKYLTKDEFYDSAIMDSLILSEYDVDFYNAKTKEDLDAINDKIKSGYYEAN